MSNIVSTYFRRMMIEKIASHLADFSPRLCSNTRALYQVNDFIESYRPSNTERGIIMTHCLEMVGIDWNTWKMVTIVVGSNSHIVFFQYCPIPVITYPQLEDELFCNIYYLRHLCNTDKFPDWPIKDSVSIRVRPLIVEALLLFVVIFLFKEFPHK